MVHRLCEFTFLVSADHFNFFGLAEVGNSQWKHPNHATIQEAFRKTNLVFVQTYTPYPKPLRSRNPFTGHPYTLTKVLGRGVIDTNPAFKSIKEAITKRVDYLSLMDATGVDDPTLRFPARMEVAITGVNLDFLRSLDLTVLVRDVLQNRLLLEVSGLGITGNCPRLSPLLGQYHDPQALHGSHHQRPLLPHGGGSRGTDRLPHHTGDRHRVSYSTCLRATSTTRSMPLSGRTASPSRT